tara:strand:- start:231 stop:818 length:588 start_codon:yes stop_codon:yes gene_type:complete
MDRKYYYVIILLVCFVSVRLIPAFSETAIAEALANISPLAALALCGAMLLPLRVAAILTFGTFLISDVALNLKYGFPIINVYSVFLFFVFALLYYLGHSLRNKKNIIVLLVSTLFSSIIFYISANTVSFFFDPGYLKNISGWVMANTTGLPGYPPAWLFGLKSLLSNIVFASAFYFALIPKHETVKITRIQSQEV